LGTSGGFEVEFVLGGDFPTWIPVLMESSSAVSAVAGKLWNFGQVALGLGFVIFVHELGHFLAAKFFGVKCEKFYVGFDVPISIGPIKLPRTLGKFQWGETEYGIGIVPLGGYVKMLGQDDDPRNAQAEAERIRTGAPEGAVVEPSRPALDPRSYPAKPVYARMIIISAGVIMNLLFAVIFAGVAFMYGVPYSPSVLGSVVGGDPGWQEGLRQGDHVIQIGRMTKPDDNLHFRELIGLVATSGLNDPKALGPVKLERDGEVKEFAVQGTAKHSRGSGIIQLGIGPATIAKVDSEAPFAPFSFLSKAKVDLQPGDRLLGINGELLPVDSATNEIPGYLLTREFQKRFRESVELAVERQVNGQPKTHVVTLPPTPLKSVGLGFRPTPVTAIAKGSLAEKGGIQVGDRIAAIDGEPVSDGWGLPLKLAQLGKEKNVVVSFDRPNPESGKEPTRIDITVEKFEPSFDSIADIAGQLTLKSIGVAFGLETEISSIDPQSAAGQAGLKAGDQLLKIQFSPTEEIKEQFLKFGSKVPDSVIVDENFTPVNFCEVLQHLPDQMKVRVYYKRDDMVKEQDVVIYEVPDQSWYTRGISMSPMMRNHRAKDFGSALVLGYGETKRRLWDVVDFLRMLVTGKVPIQFLGGPVRIVQAASSQAAEGVPAFLLFLTLLSANLAVINFLPIPALDGGHMMFLAAEAVRGKPVDENWQIRLTMAGVLGLLCLMAFVIINDIVQIIR
jgi:regulator of sigma E protease